MMLCDVIQEMHPRESYFVNGNEELQMQLEWEVHKHRYEFHGIQNEKEEYLKDIDQLTQDVSEQVQVAQDGARFVKGFIATKASRRKHKVKFTDKD
jgi:hypothetical protein